MSRRKKPASHITVGGTVGLVLFLSWLHGPKATLRGIGEACVAIANEPPLVFLTAKQLDGLISTTLLEALAAQGVAR